METVDRIVAIWVDGDSCPVPVRELLCRVSRRRRIPVRFCANRTLPIPTGANDGLIEMHLVSGTTVDEYLVEALVEALENPRQEIPLVVTRDIPLAERLVLQGVATMNDRGRLFERDSIRELRSLRDAREAIRASGLERMSRASTFGERELKRFADALDRFLTQAYRDG